MEPLGPRPTITGADASIFLPERRSRPRYRTHTPAYARLNRDAEDLVLDLSAILDINEEGISVQAAPPLEANRNVNLCIDLSETNTKIQTPGFVVWSDRSGRAGIRLPSLPNAARQQLREWLFLNALAACADSSVLDAKAADASAEQTKRQVSPDAKSASVPTNHIEEEISSARDLTTILVALEAVQKEVESLAKTPELALELLAERARAFTRASGAAIASYPGELGETPPSFEGRYMVCRASAGSAAPPVGAKLQVGSGFSGQCVRSGSLLRCDDAETDLYVDRESCRLLGLRSMLATPIRDANTVIGLLEVFSPSAYAFNDDDNQILQRLSDTALTCFRVTDAVQQTAVPEFAFEDSFTASAKQATAAARGSEEHLPRILRRGHLVFLLTVAALIALALGFLVAPWIDGKWGRAPARHQAKEETNRGIPTPNPTLDAVSMDDLRKLADQDDAAAQFALGAHYATGEDVAQDYGQAFQWFAKSAEQGNVAAQSALGAYYWVGRGVSRDLEKAYFWSILARAGGDETSKYRVAVLTSRMTRPQILNQQQEAENWLKRHQAGGVSPGPVARRRAGGTN